MCPECSVKLNYRSQKREVKRKKALKRLGTTTDVCDSAASTSAELAQSPEIEIKEEPLDENSVEPKKDETEIWKGKPIDGIEKSREEEFEEYLADLFL